MNEDKNDMCDIIVVPVEIVDVTYETVFLM